MGSPVTEANLVRLTLPRLGETMEEARVTGWLKQPGDEFKRGDVLLEVETDKTVVEVPAMQDGILVAQLVTPGDVVALDEPIADIEVAGIPASSVAPIPAVPAEPRPNRAAPVVTMPQPATARPAASPRARQLARDAGVSLGTLIGTGRRGRITGQDVQAANSPQGGLIRTRFGSIALRRLAAIGPAKTPILLLHGLHDEGRGWRDLPDRLARAGHPVLIPDLPGHGASDAETSDTTEATEALAEALTQTLPQGPVRLVGHSFGAILATSLAVRLGPRTERLVLIAPAGLGPRINAEFLALMASAEAPAALARAMCMLGAGPVSDITLRQELARILHQRPATAALARTLNHNGIQQIDIAPDLARIIAPTVAIFGTADQIVDWRDCASLPPTTAIHLIRDAGHLPHAAAPDLIAGLIAGNPTPLQGGPP